MVSMYVDMSVGVEKGSSEEQVMSPGISGVGRVKFLWLVAGFGNGQGLLGPVNGGVCHSEPGVSKDDVLLSATHDIEEMFLCDSFNVHVEDAV